jgi:hypothetical protein
MALNQLKDHYVGRFLIGKRRLLGRLILSGPDTRLEIYSPAAPMGMGRTPSLRGVTQTGERVTLCVVDWRGATSGPTADGKRYNTNQFFPHYVAIGKRLFDPNHRVISAISFTTDRANSIFSNDDCFGIAQVNDITSILPDRAKNDGRPIKHGELFYYVSKGPIASVHTKTVNFVVNNVISYKWPSAAGIHLDNVIRLRLEFPKPVELQDAINAAFDFRCFCELLTVGPHCISEVQIEHKNASEKEHPISLIISNSEKPNANRAVERRSSLILAGSHPKDFETVLSNWMATQTKRRIARLRLIEGPRGETFTIERLVAAANAYDLLPFKSQPLPPQVQSKLTELRKVVKTSLQSPYRDPILGAIGRLKGHNLRSKIVARFHVLPKPLQSKFPDMETVIGYCVQARNYFVHGTEPPTLSAKTIEAYWVFFTRTLEFIFIVTELSDCGWRWNSKATDSRWFWSYLDNYEHDLKDIKEDLAKDTSLKKKS